MSETGTQRECPGCGRVIPVDKRYVTWCDGCDWNADPLPADAALPEWRLRLERRLAEAMYREVGSTHVRKPDLGASRVLTYVLSGLVLLLPLSCALIGVAVLMLWRPLWLAVPLGVIALAAAWLFMPRPRRMPEDVVAVDRSQAPRLYAMVDQVATALGIPKVSAIVVDPEPNVWFTEIGWGRRPVVGIGLPLWFSLTPQERLAILAHELGHGRNGDARHGFVVSSAESVLMELAHTFGGQPLDCFRRDLGYRFNASGTEVGVNLINRIVNAVVGSVVRGYAFLLYRLDLHDSQRSEYLADLHAGDVAGSDAAASALERTVLADTGYRALERALRYEPDTDPVEAIRRAVADVPKREVDRRLRVSKLRGTRTDATHPPTHLRIGLLRARPATSPRVVLGLNDAVTIDRELADATAHAIKQLRDSLPR